MLINRYQILPATPPGIGVLLLWRVVTGQVPSCPKVQGVGALAGNLLCYNLPVPLVDFRDYAVALRAFLTC